MSSSVDFRLDGLFRVLLCKGDVDSAVHLEVALKAGEIDEDRAHRALLRAQRELAHRCPRDHFAHHTPNGTSGIVLLAVEGLGWDIAEDARNADQDVIAGLRRKLAGQARHSEETDSDPAARTASLMKLPEALVNRVKSDSGSAAAGIVVGDDCFKRDEGAFRQQVFPKRSARSDSVLRRSESGNARSRRLARTDSPTL